MSKTVVINLGNGDLHNGFPSVTAQIRSDEHLPPEQFIGSLPAAPDLVELYRNWRSIYQALCTRQSLRSQGVEEDDKLEIEAGAITNVSLLDFDELCQKLQENINTWLKSAEFLTIERQLRSQLDQAAEIRVILETDDYNLRRLPLHRWDFFKDYPKAELALSRPEYQRRESLQPTFTRNQVRILAILGNSQGIDLQIEASFLKSLEDIAEVVSLNNPSRQEFNTQLWDSTGWDILFFAGHSQTEGDTGRIYINENQINNSLTIEQLEEALIAAIEKGLKLAIFNSCDGVGLANALGRLHIPQVIVMREPVPNYVAQIFFQNFLQAFAIERKPLYLAVQQARRQLQGLEDDFPGASWLPLIFQNPAVEPSTWLKLGGIPPCPYRGLFAFQEEDAYLFFGREQFTSDLVAAMKRKPLVAVVGASGSGKSSVVFAGLIPRLRQDPNVQWQIVSFRPENNPFAALARAFSPLLEDKNARYLVELELAIAFQQDDKTLYKIIERLVQQRFGTRLVLVADQFEELYTLCPEEERQPFLDGLLNAVRLAPAFTLVTTLRADFYGYALSYRPLSDALQGAVQNLGPMSREELCQAIEQPAIQMQVGLENGLTNKLINGIHNQPGRLPLLEFALTTLWSKQRNGLLTHQAYKEIGGVEEALANHAEAVYAQLAQTDRLRSQRVFMQLVYLGEGAEATRRLATSHEVGLENWDLVTRLADARLVVTNHNESTQEETIEIVHEALIRSWGRLEQWMLVDGEFRRWQEQLRAAIRQWESSSCDRGALLRGKPLADAEYWQNQRWQELSIGERSFIGQSLELHKSEIRKHKRRRQLIISWLVVGLVLAVTLAGIAWWQGQKARTSEIKEIRSSAETFLNLNHEFDALIASIRAGIRIKNTFEVDANTLTEAVETLLQAVNFVRERNRLEGHKQPIKTTAFSPDGQMIVTGSADGTVKLWSLDGKQLQSLTAHKQAVNSATFSPDGQMIVTGSADGTVKLWSLDGKQLQSLTAHKQAVNSATFSPDGQMIVTGSADGTVKLWSLDGKQLQSLTAHKQAVNSATFSPDGQMIVTGSADGTVKLWSLDGKELKTLPAHNQPVNSATFSPDGQVIVTGSADGTVKLWSLDGKELKTLPAHNQPVNSATFSPDGQIIASASNDNTVKLWSLDGKELKTLYGHSNVVKNVAFSPDGKIIASASADKTVKLWSIDGKELKTLYGHSNEVTSISFSPDSKIIATASSDTTVKLWSLYSQYTKILRGHQEAVFGLVFSLDGKMIASASWDKTVKLWNQDGKELKTLKGHKDKVNRVSFSPDGKIIASASADKTVKLWSIDGNDLKTLKRHQKIVWSVSFSPDGNLIATASEDGTVKLWNRDGKELKTLRKHSSVVNGATFSPDGKMIATASWDTTVKLWSIEGQELRTLRGHKNGINSVTFSPNGKMIATASYDNTAKLWNLDGKELQTLKGHKDGVNSIAFSPDSQKIATASSDNTIKIWNLDGKELQTLKGHKDVVWSVSFSPDGKSLATSSSDNTVILWYLYLEDLDKLLVRACEWTRDYLKNNPNVNQEVRHFCTAISQTF
ncbi:CHAT domain-containing protein [Nostoc sp. FACHB-133]|uniref:nSTAND1 domain-containing NTPase n=1 Tax=Nostoc sp. FACHB-133 TaxID=2692835 RepID=UPI001683F7E6|nr:CHAT domain-containing protein [Nostoc sp. FACHB-133]MBD2526661.1 CHAT domain-containing protein [Nostoc sp. FACHB-133]